MNKVWLVYTEEWPAEDEYFWMLRGVFATEKLAKAAAKKQERVYADCGPGGWPCKVHVIECKVEGAEEPALAGIAEGQP